MSDPTSKVFKRHRHHHCLTQPPSVTAARPVHLRMPAIGSVCAWGLIARGRNRQVYSGRRLARVLALCFLGIIVVRV